MGEADAMRLQTFESVRNALEETAERAAALRLRSDLLYGIVSSIEVWDATQPQVEARLAVTSAKLDDLLRGDIDLLSLDDLVAIASRAGVTVRVERTASAA